MDPEGGNMHNRVIIARRLEVWSRVQVAVRRLEDLVRQLQDEHDEEEAEAARGSRRVG